MMLKAPVSPVYKMVNGDIAQAWMSIQLWLRCAGS